MTKVDEADEVARAALARLTEREKDCLRRRLLHQTAKEMALELGVSPHAVEKRLKTARAKLGVGSSLEAARKLAALEGYQRLGAQSPDLAMAASATQKRSEP
jgi:DNA-binding CsgD family transcriptional regulator